MIMYVYREWKANRLVGLDGFQGYFKSQEMTRKNEEEKEEEEKETLYMNIIGKSFCSFFLSFSLLVRC